MCRKVCPYGFCKSQSDHHHADYAQPRARRCDAFCALVLRVLALRRGVLARARVAFPTLVVRTKRCGG